MGTSARLQYVFAAKGHSHNQQQRQILLYHKEDSEQYFLQENNENQQLQLDLENPADWSFVALSENHQESEMLKISLQKADENLSLALWSEDNDSGVLRPGWNLIGIPCDFMPAADAALPSQPMLILEPESQSYVQAARWQSAQAYWLFVDEEFDGLQLPGIQVEAEEHDLLPGWNLSSCPELFQDAPASSWLWQDGQYKALKGELKKGQAAWFFQE